MEFSGGNETDLFTIGVVKLWMFSTRSLACKLCLELYWNMWLRCNNLASQTTLTRQAN